ncbi:MAG TPA: diacylglycerol kinase family protein [Spongiibacteraceae bacterium]|jgi:diacylglycerol kinase|nr:diacylglycerol kinase family protein [Spongiibacteraceae bacterium]HUH38783.1 diacylglycerol kinase family protein [Spongiibacteraceae bacterium]
MTHRPRSPSSAFDLRARWQSLRCAVAGLADLLRDQPHARLHALAAVVATGLGGWLGLSRLEWVLLVLTIGLVWAMEALNSALEYLADASVPQQHPLVRKAKDVAAAGVLLAALAALVNGVLLFGPPLYRLWF